MKKSEFKKEIYAKFLEDGQKFIHMNMLHEVMSKYPDYVLAWNTQQKRPDKVDNNRIVLIKEK